MGALLPSNDDIQIIDKLNDRFSGRRLKKLRDHIGDNADDMFGPGRSLHRVAHRLKTFPSSTGGKGRWYVFLKTLLNEPARTSIREALRDAVGDTDCVGIRFWARYEPNLLTDYDAEVVQGTPDAQGKFWVTITLVCDHEIDAGEPGDPTKPPKDNGETGPEFPNLTAAAKGKKPKKGSAPRKTAKKKSAKKAKKKK